MSMKVLCPQCRQSPMTIQEDGQMRCLAPCGYVGREGLLPDVPAEAHLSGFSIGDLSFASEPVQEDPLVDLTPAAEALYCRWHGVTPDALTKAGQEEAREWLPFLAAVAAVVWQEAYDQGVHDEVTSASNIGIAGLGGKVNPARANPYRGPEGDLPVPPVVR